MPFPDHLWPVVRWALKLPIYIYRYTLSFLVGRTCRYEPSCSQYAIDAINVNGAWRGFWLMLSRLYRCRPGGSHGFDPAPDIREQKYPLWQAWKYGIWQKSEGSES